MVRKTKLRILVLLCAPIAMTSSLTYASLPAIAADPLFDALRDGDVDAVHRAEQTEKAGEAIVRMDDAQLRYDIPHLLPLAEKCQQRAFDLPNAVGYGAALHCNDVARGSALILGDAREFLKQAAWARKTLFAPLSKSLNTPVTFEDGLQKADLDALADRTPAVTATWQGTSQTLSYGKVSTMGVLAIPKPTLRINGQAQEASIATDQVTVTPVAIITSPEDADALVAKLGLQPLVMDFESVTVDFHGSSFQVKLDLYLAPSVEFGPLKLSHVAVMMMKTDYLPAEIEVGMPMLRQFGEVTIADDHVVLSQGASACEEGAPLVFGADSNLYGSMSFPMAINGKPGRGTFDMKTSLPYVLNPAYQETLKDNEPVTVTVGAWTLGGARVLPRGKVKMRDASLGFPLLKDNAVHLRFDTPTPSICLAKNKP